MKLTNDSTQVTSDLVAAILTGLSTTFEGRRAEVGLAQARAETLTAISLAAEAVYFYLGGDLSKLGEVLAESTLRRLVDAAMPTFEMGAEAQDELLTLLSTNDSDSNTTHTYNKTIH